MTSIVWWEIETPWPGQFQDFHAALWGWTFDSAFQETDLNADYWIIKAQGQGIGGLQRSAPDAPPPQAGVRLYLKVDDLEATLEQVRALGGIIERSRTELGGDDRWFGTILDPAGVSLGLWTDSPAKRRLTAPAGED